MQEVKGNKNSDTSPKAEGGLKSKLKPLGKLKCTSSNCGEGLHCFLATRKMIKENTTGRCRSCGISLIDWERVHDRNLKDITYTFNSLKREYVRHHFWHIEIDVQAENHARRKGKRGMREAAEKRIRKYVGPAEPTFDGRQTPKSGNAIFYAQHATATCCRKCIQEWHGIKMGIELTSKQISYFADLVMLFIEERLPNLTVDGEKVPPITGRRRLVGHSDLEAQADSENEYDH